MAELPPALEPVEMPEARTAEAFINRRHAFPSPPHPDLIGRLELPGMCDDELMALFAEAHAWAEYLDWQVGLLAIDAKRLARKAERSLNSKVLSLRDGDVKTNAEAVRIAENEPVIQSLQDRAEDAADREAMCRRALSASERAADKLSREITRRVKRDPIEQRAARYGT